MKINPNILRKHVLDMVYDKKSGHIGGSFSIADVIAYLYSNFNLATIDMLSDKLILSKGHAVPILYAVFYELQLLNDNDMKKFREIDSPLQGHPVREKLSLLHATTGSLGQGLSIAIGHALAMKLLKQSYKIFCILGDGEVQEGQIWEAFMLAPKYKLNNLIVMVDINKGQSEGFTKDILDIEDMEQKVKSFNWNVIRINGNDMGQIDIAVKLCVNNKVSPNCILLDTIKGKGVSFMEGPNWHSRNPTEAEYFQAIKELNI
jgi:transketolase